MKRLHDDYCSAAPEPAVRKPMTGSTEALLLDHLFELAEVLGAVMERGVAAHGLTRARAGLLWALCHGGPVTQRALAAALHVTPRNVTGLLDALQSDGLVHRAAHPTDRRATLVSLTAAGRETTAALRAGRDELALELFGDMPVGRREALLAGMTTVTARLRD